MFDGEEYVFIPKERLSRAFTGLVREISATIYQYDPIGLKSCPKDEYDPEAVRVAARLRYAKSEHDVKAILLDVIAQMFGEKPDAQAAKLDTAVQEIWRAWSTYVKLARPQSDDSRPA